MNPEEGQFPGEGLPPMPGVTLPAEDSSSQKESLEIVEAPGPEGEIIAIGDLIPEEGLPVPEFRTAAESEEAAEVDAPTEEELKVSEDLTEDIEVDIVPEEEIEEPESEEGIRVEIVPEEELAIPEPEEDIEVDIVPEEELEPALPAKKTGFFRRGLRNRKHRREKRGGLRREKRDVHHRGIRTGLFRRRH